MSQGIDSTALQSSGYNTAQLIQEKNQRIELIARIFAETGVKDMALAVHKLARQHQQKGRTIRLRNKWVPIDPSQWKDRMDLTTMVGLGAGNKDQQLIHFGTVRQQQNEIFQMQGNAGDRQIPDLNHILVSGNGGVLSYHACLVLGSDAN